MRFLLVYILVLLAYIGNLYFNSSKGTQRSAIPYFISGIALYLISILFDMADNIIKALLYSTGLFG